MLNKKYKNGKYNNCKIFFPKKNQCCQNPDDLKIRGEVITDKNSATIRNTKLTPKNEAIIKQVTEANDNLSIIDLRNKNFYDVKENTNKNVSITKLSDINFDTKNFGTLDYVNYSLKLNIEVNLN